MPSQIQALNFIKSYWTPKEAKKWLFKHNFEPIKHVDITPHLYRYRLVPPSTFRKFRIKKLTPSIEAVIGFK